MNKGIIVPSMLLVQTVVKVEAEIQTAAINHQPTISELHILEEVLVPLNICGKALDTH